MAESGIYEIVNRVNGKRYVGSAVNFAKRWREHRSDLRRGVHHSRALQRAWIKYGEASFYFDVLAQCERERLIEEEQKAFDHLRPEYNICKVAGSMMGVSPSDETRRKLSDALKNREFSDEHRQKISAALVEKRACGWGLSPEARERIAAKRRGSKASPETRAKLSAARKGRRTVPIGFKHSDEMRKRASERMSANPTFGGRTHSQEARAKISAARKGKGHPVSDVARAKLRERMTGNSIWLGRQHKDETKRKLQQAFLGRTFSDETLARMSVAHLGKRHSESTRAKMSEGRRGARNGAAIKIIFTIENEAGDILSGTPMELRELTGIGPAGMTQMLNGKQKTAKGWRRQVVA